LPSGIQEKEGIPNTGPLNSRCPTARGIIPAGGGSAKMRQTMKYQTKRRKRDLFGNDLKRKESVEKRDSKKGGVKEM